MYSILRIRKISDLTTLRSAANHNARVVPPANADPELTPLNRVVLGTGDAAADVAKHLAAHGNPKPRVAKADKSQAGVVAIEMMLTASLEFFDRDGETAKERDDRIDKWMKVEGKALRAKWGEHIVSAILHLDEKTPHLHVVAVPLVKKIDGRSKNKEPKWMLSAKDLIGGDNATMSREQDRHHAIVAEVFPELGRGQVGSQKRHTTAAEWDRQQKEELAAAAAAHKAADRALATVEKKTQALEMYAAGQVERSGGWMGNWSARGDASGLAEMILNDGDSLRMLEQAHTLVSTAVEAAVEDAKAVAKRELEAAQAQVAHDQKQASEALQLAASSRSAAAAALVEANTEKKRAEQVRAAAERKLEDAAAALEAAVTERTAARTAAAREAGATLASATDVKHQAAAALQQAEKALARAETDRAAAAAARLAAEHAATAARTTAERAVKAAGAEAAGLKKRAADALIQAEKAAAAAQADQAAAATDRAAAAGDRQAVAADLKAFKTWFAAARVSLADQIDQLAEARRQVVEFFNGLGKAVRQQLGPKTLAAVIEMGPPLAVEVAGESVVAGELPVSMPRRQASWGGLVFILDDDERDDRNRANDTRIKPIAPDRGR